MFYKKWKRKKNLQKFGQKKRMNGFSKKTEGKKNYSKFIYGFVVLRHDLLSLFFFFFFFF